MTDKMDKHIDNGICFEKTNAVKCWYEVMPLDENNMEMLNSIYKDFYEEFGLDITMRVYQLYKGTQVNFPMRFLNPELVKRQIIDEFDGTNLKQLAIKYNYSEKTLRRLIKNSIK